MKPKSSMHFQENYQKILFFMEFKDIVFFQEFPDFPGVLGTLILQNFVLSSSNLTDLTLDRQISFTMIILKTYSGKNILWKMEVLQIFGLWDQEIGSWFTNCEPLIPTLRHLFLTINKSFIGPHLDYGDIIHDQPNNQAFSNKLEVAQYIQCSISHYCSYSRYIKDKSLSGTRIRLS